MHLPAGHGERHALPDAVQAPRFHPQRGGATVLNLAEICFLLPFSPSEALGVQVVHQIIRRRAGRAADAAPVRRLLLQTALPRPCHELCVLPLPFVMDDVFRFDVLMGEREAEAEALITLEDFLVGVALCYQRENLGDALPLFWAMMDYVRFVCLIEADAPQPFDGDMRQFCGRLFGGVEKVSTECVWVNLLCVYMGWRMNGKEYELYCNRCHVALIRVCRSLAAKEGTVSL